MGKAGTSLAVSSQATNLAEERRLFYSGAPKANRSNNKTASARRKPHLLLTGDLLVPQGVIGATGA
jgi:hypothetical protein